MALDTYTNLKAAVADWLNRTDLTNAIPDFIRLAEDKFARHPAVEFERREVLTLQTSPTALPSDCRELRALWYDDTVRYGPIEIVPAERAPYEKLEHGATGAPRKAVVVDNGTNLLLAPTPDQAYTVNALILTKLTRLSATVAVNALLTDHSDLYLYGALLESAPYLKDDERVVLWQAKYDAAMEQLNQLVWRRRFPGPLVMRPRRAIG